MDSSYSCYWDLTALHDPVNFLIMCFPIIPEDLATVARIFKRAGFQCWLVGGALRDQLLGRSSSDFDLATDAKPKQIAGLFHRTIPTGIKHGTVSILLGSHQFETTTFRSDGPYHDGRRPEGVSFSKDILVDLARRDFTINAIAWDLLNGKLIDPHQGREDLKKRIIRAIGNPKIRFEEDKLRMIRACRFASQLNCTITPETLSAINPIEIGNLSVERIWDEVKKILTSQKPSIAFRLFRSTGLLEILLPELSACIRTPLSPFDSVDVFSHSLNVCDSISRDNIRVRAAALLHDIGKPLISPVQRNGTIAYPNHEAIGATITRNILKRYKASKSDRDVISRLVHHHGIRCSDDWNDATVRCFMKDVGTDILDDILTLLRANSQDFSVERLAEQIHAIQSNNDALEIENLALDGHVLMDELKLEPSVTVGKLLQHLLDLAMENPECNHRERLLKLAREWLDVTPHEHPCK